VEALGDGVEHELSGLRIVPDPSGAPRATIEISPEAPWFRGHFPGQPVLPGAALLAAVRIAAGLILDPAIEVTGFAAVRFRNHLRPGDRAELELHVGMHAGFRITRGTVTIARGRLALRGGEA
jgi:3-hydroxymyristoyl/3-hydroxydecanoyl-(acyl carrier protein) dehydratase